MKAKDDLINQLTDNENLNLNDPLEIVCIVNKWFEKWFTNIFATSEVTENYLQMLSLEDLIAFKERQLKEMKQRLILTEGIKDIFEDETRAGAPYTLSRTISITALRKTYE